MWERDCGALPVVDQEGRVAGMVTDRDICMAAYTQGRPIHAVPVEKVMAQHVFSCGANDSIEDAEAIMHQFHVHRLPVVDSEQHVVGVLSLDDLAQRGEPE
jgi:CBS domain-containing protein